MQPHKSRYWLNADPDDPEEFRRQSAGACELYERAGRLAEQGVHVVSADEKTGMQALERLHPDIPMGPGRPQGREFEYVRHGTLCLIANLGVWCGHVIAPSVGPTRCEADFRAHVEQTVNTGPLAGWVFTVDNLDTHQSEGLVRYVAQACGVGGGLGAKGESGVLASEASRKAFLSDPSHRIRFAYTPRHCSRLNRVGLRFGILSRKLLRRASFASAGRLEARALAFVEYSNATMAMPVRWLYSPRPLVDPPATD